MLGQRHSSIDSLSTANLCRLISLDSLDANLPPQRHARLLLQAKRRGRWRQASVEQLPQLTVVFLKYSSFLPPAVRSSSPPQATLAQDTPVRGTVKLPEGVYTGDLDGDVPRGQGKLVFKDGSSYEGEWVEGKRHGNGKMVWPSGDTYEGQHVDNERSGKGKFTWAGGNTYVGDYRQEKRHGKGVYTWADGERYEGEFEWDHRTGQGTYYYLNGDKYCGHFYQGIKNGYGVYYYHNGDRYGSCV